MGFKMIYWTPMSGSYSLYVSILEKCGNFLKNGRFSGRIWTDWGNTTRADMAELGSIGLTSRGFPSLGIGITLPIFHESGKVLNLIYRLKMCVKWPGRASIISRIMREDTPSIAEEFVILICLANSITTSGVISVKLRLLGKCWPLYT